jgi:malonyl-CoA O-methyltransferase
MAAESPPRSTRPVDALALRRIRQRLQAATTVPWLHEEAARRMAERLPLIRKQPQRIVEWGARLGASQALLAQAYPAAKLVLVDEPGVPMREVAPPPWWTARRWGRRVDHLGPQQLPEASAELVWSNMGLHLEADIEALMQAWRRCIEVDGFLMFSTLGPGSFAQLRQLYREQGWLGDMLVHAGFAEPVMDQELLTLTWPSAAAMLAELRGLGGNAHRQRAAGLHTPRWHGRLLKALEARRGADGRLHLDIELVYGHAFCPAPKPSLGPQTNVSLEDMRRMVRSGRRAR